MTEIRKTVRLFGDEITLAISLNGATVTGIRPIRGKDKTMSIVSAVGRQIESGKPLAEIGHNATVLQELVWLLFAEQEARNDRNRDHA